MEQKKPIHNNKLRQSLNYRSLDLEFFIKVVRVEDVRDVGEDALEDVGDGYVARR